MTETMPVVSVILPTYNRLERLKQVLAALAHQTVPPDDFEVVVVSDGSSDGTSEFLQAYQPPFRLVPILQANQGVAVARNSGLAKARANLVLFVDDDVVPAPQLIAEHLASHAAAPDAGSPAIGTPTFTVTLGPMLTPPDAPLAPWVSWEQQMLEKQYQSMAEGLWEPTARQFYTGNTSLARQVVLDAGGFDPAFRRAEDVELAYRLKDRGARFVFNARAVGHHYAFRSYESWQNIAYAYGRNDVIMTRAKHQDWLLPAVLHEYRLRSPFIRGLTGLCLDRPRLSRVLLGVLKQTALISHRAGLTRLSRYAFSGIFNLRYYQGLADELGGRQEFQTALATSHAWPA